MESAVARWTTAIFRNIFIRNVGYVFGIGVYMFLV